MSISADGLARWTPLENQAPSTNTVTVRLSDDGQPSLSSTADYIVVVRSRSEVPELRLTVPEDGSPMILEIRAKQGQSLALESATTLGQWMEAQRLVGLGLDTPVRLALPPVVLDPVQFWRVRTLP